MQKLEAQLPEYLAALHDFIDRHDLPSEWFEQPDHIAYKCADSKEFDAVMAELASGTEQRSSIELNNRRLGSAHLTIPLHVGEFGTIEWLEIMEPRPERAGTDIVGLEHMEFYFPDFDAIREHLDEHGVSYDMQDNPSHAWVNIVINDEGQELKLNDGTLAHIVEDEIDQDLATLL